MGCCFLGCKSNNENRQKQLTILSFNLRYDNSEDGTNAWTFRKEACVKMIKDVNPSIFGIQEGLKHQVDFLSNNLQQYERVGVARDDGDTLGEYCAVFFLKDRFELIESGNFWLSETPTKPSLGWDAACKRIVTWAKLYDSLTMKYVFFFNTHFDHVGMVARKNSVHLLMHEINSLVGKNARVFITGDFNDNVKSPIFIPLLNHYFNARQKAEETDSYATFNNWNKSEGEQIDYIFYRGEEIVKYKTIIDDYGVPYLSDHYPIMAIFK